MSDVDKETVDKETVDKEVAVKKPRKAAVPRAARVPKTSELGSLPDSVASVTSVTLEAPVSTAPSIETNEQAAPKRKPRGRTVGLDIIEPNNIEPNNVEPNIIEGNISAVPLQAEASLDAQAPKVMADLGDATQPRAPRNANRRGGRGGRGQGRNARDDNRAEGSRAPRVAADEIVDDDPLPVLDIKAPIGRNAADPDRSGRAPRPRPRPLDDDSSKLHKVLADAGLGSRREMEDLIVQGRVSVNNTPAHVGQRLNPNDQVRVNGKPIRRRAVHVPPRVLLYHKPAGEMVSRDDPNHRPLVFDRLPRLQGARWVAVGRLDFNTEGLLVFTTSGDLANKLMHPRYGWDREYAVRILGRLDEQAREKLMTGVELEDGPAAFSHVEELGGDGSNCWYKVVINEGRNREVRRMFEMVGLMVSRLCRVRFGPIALPTALRRSRWVELAEGDMRLLNDAMRTGSGAEGAESSAPAGPKTPRSRNGRKERGQPAATRPGNRGRTPNPMYEGLPRDEDDQPYDENDPLEHQPPAYMMPPVDKTPVWDNDDGDDFEIPEDEWQPRGANAHLEGISKVVKKRSDGVPGSAAPGGNRGASRRPPGAGGRPMRTRPGQASRAFTGPMDTPRVDNEMPVTPNRNGGRGNGGGRNGAGRNGGAGNRTGNATGNRRPNGGPRPFGSGNTAGARTDRGEGGAGGGNGGGNSAGNVGNQRRSNNGDSGNRSADANGNRAAVTPRPQGGERPPQQRPRRRNNQRPRPDGVNGSGPANGGNGAEPAGE